MTKRDAPDRPEPSSLTVIEGGRRQREEELLREFLRPGVGNLREIRRLANRLQFRARLTLANHERLCRD
jgi:hypothetical protein